MVLQKKICMLGSFAVGKSSLVRRYVDDTFSDKYITTIGVQIAKKLVTVGGTQTSLIVWDVYGEDHFQSVLPSYLRGLAGYILVVDPTRASSFESALSLHQLVKENMGLKPFVLALNKVDLRKDWVLEDELDSIKNEAYGCIETSAKSGLMVPELFEKLAAALIPADSQKLS